MLRFFRQGTGGAVSVYVTDETNVIIDINGYFLPDQPDTTNQSTASGAGALASDTSATRLNSAFGNGALADNTTGYLNTATGGAALLSNTTGLYNMASGVNALLTNTTLVSNTAVGAFALQGNSVGSSNTAVGYISVHDIIESNNIDIANVGFNYDSGVIRIGTAGSQSSPYIAGSHGSARHRCRRYRQFFQTAWSRSFVQKIQEDIGDTTPIIPLCGFGRSRSATEEPLRSNMGLSRKKWTRSSLP